MKKFIILALVLLSATALARPPKWVSQVHWEDGQYDYFVGTSSKSESEEVGRREAFDNAMAEAVQSLFGISGRMDLASYANLQKIQISQDVFIATDEVQLKAESIDVYVEKMKEDGRTLYNVWRSIKVDKKAAKEELARLKTLAEKKKTTEGKVMAPDPDIVAVTSQGSAVVTKGDEPSAKAAAIKSGIRRACENLIASWFYQEMATNNYSKLNSVIYNRCPTFVKNYDVGAGFAEGNVYKVDLTVYLKSGDIGKKLMEIGLYRQIFPPRGNAIFSQPPQGMPNAINRQEGVDTPSPLPSSEQN